MLPDSGTKTPIYGLHTRPGGGHVDVKQGAEQAAASAGQKRPSTPPQATRRGVLAGLIAVGGAAIGAVLGLPGVAYVLDPLLRKREGKGGFRKVAELSRLSKEHPVAVPVLGEQTDAWTRAPERKLGTVWLRLLDNDKVEALNAECPHLGCKVGYDESHKQFACPCHESAFSLDGAVKGGPAPRAMDSLEARVVDGSVEVRFVRFRAQVKERIEIG